MPVQLPPKAVFAHRGASADAPENTLAAFSLAMQQQADGIELDVTLSADGKIVVLHDDDLDRTTNGQGPVSQHTLAELRQLDAGSWFSADYAGERLPTLAEVLELVGERMFINIELKGFSPQSRMLPDKVTTLVRHYQLGHKVIFSSFDPRLLAKTKRQMPEATIGLLLLSGSMGGLVKRLLTPWLRPWSLHPHHSSITPAFMQHARQKGLAVVAYTVDQPEDMRRLFGLGIDGIITNTPLKAISVRTEETC